MFNWLNRWWIESDPVADVAYLGAFCEAALKWSAEAAALGCMRESQQHARTARNCATEAFKIAKTAQLNRR